ncbi:MAG: hypothetical protein AAFR81_12710 [Chloroflexota bacterium]
MSDKKRTLWDDIVELGRDIVETLDEALHPEKKRKPAPVPIPVRQHPPRRNPHNESY